MRIAVTAIIVFLISGCANKYKTDAFDPPAQPLSSSASAYVMLAADGAFGSSLYSGSGRSTSQATVAAVSAHLNRVDMASNKESRDEALRSAKAKGINYVFEPTILHWEDRATEWSGRPDRITIKVVVWDVETGMVLASTVARASSKWGTFGGDHPQDLLPHTMTTFVNGLFAGK